MFNFVFVTEFDIVKHFHKIKTNAIGLDNIQPVFLKYMLPKLLPYICYMFNTILRTASYPLQWKNAKVLALPKSANEFRPISILPFMSKVFESMLHEQISEFLCENNILTQFQSGYRPGHNCVSALINLR